MRRTSGAGAGKGAAEEPEPEPGDAPPSSSSGTTTTYDPREYQPPHPDDRLRGADGKATKKGAGGKAKTRGKEGGAKGKEDTHRCANCDAPGAKMKCGRCGVERYCDQDCQKVGGHRGRVR